MTNKDVNLCVIGAGNIATRHLANLDFIGGNRVVAIADTRIDAAKEKAEPISANAYSDWQAMLEKEQDVDGVLVCTPPTVRKPVFEAAARGSIAVFCEKPPTQTLAEAWEIARIVEESGMISSVGFNCRYAPSVDECKRLIGSQLVNITTATSISPTALMSGPKRLDDWFFQKERGGSLFDALIHTLDLIVYIAGQAESVQAFGTNAVIPVSEAFTIEDTMSINIRFASGGTGSVVCSFAAAQGARELTFFGRDFQISVDAIPPRLHARIGAVGSKPEITAVDYPQGPDMGRSGKIHPNRKPEDPPDPPHHLELEVFVEAIRTGSTEKIRSPFPVAAETMALAEAITDSIESGEVEKVQRRV